MNNKLAITFLINLIFFVSICGQNKKEQKLGEWGVDVYDMPYFRYTGKLPYKAEFNSGKEARILNDPYFLLGNYRFKLFTHTSGEYEIYSTDRVISHFNKKEDVQAVLKVNGTSYNLTGVNSVSADPDKTSRVFGAGFAEYTYSLPNIVCKRVLSVLPSDSLHSGASAFRISLCFKNISDEKVKLIYTESLKTAYNNISNAPTGNVAYGMQLEKLNSQLIKGTTKIISANDPFPIVEKDDFSLEEYFPPMFFFSAEFKGKENLFVSRNKCVGSFNTTLKPGEQKIIDFIVGYTHSENDDVINKVRKELMKADFTPNMKDVVSESPFSKQWSKKVKHYKKETNNDLRRELIWHNYVLESMASYSDYFKETFIPQGCMYFFSWGQRAAPRDHCQHALATCYTNPELAKSIMRYILKKSDRKGNIPFVDIGNGVVTSLYYQTSDQQLFFFMILAEYLRITGDYEFLLEEVDYYPGKDAGHKTVLERVGEYYRYLVEEIGIGPNGLIRLGNSDWNDMVFYRLKAQYNTIYHSNESHMNTTMAASYLPKLTVQLLEAARLPEFKKNSQYIHNLSKSIENYRARIWGAFLKDYGNRKFSKRMYFNYSAVGEDNMFLEPQGFLMQVADFDINKKKQLYAEIKTRVLDNEVIGARQEEKMELSELFFGSRENGGIWYSLNGPLIIGLSTWNKEAAWSLFHKMTLKNQAEHFPNYWSSYWSSFDSVDSSILESQGMHTQQEWISVGSKMTYCSHIHAWLIYSYNYLKELD